MSGLAGKGDADNGSGGGGGQKYTVLTATSGHLFGEGKLDNADVAYQGANRSWVKLLLERAPGPWSIDATGTSTSVPKLQESLGSLPCIRDAYVAAAVLGAWAAESHSRQGKQTLAADDVKGMMENLHNAQELCSDAPVVGGGGTCATVRIYKCGELK